MNLEILEHNFYGSILHVTEQGLCLMISYDDLSESEISNFCEANIEITYKMFEFAAVFVLDFQNVLEVVPLNWFETAHIWKAWKEREILLEIVIKDYEKKMIVGRRTEKLSSSRCESWITLMENSYKKSKNQYSKKLFQNQLQEIFDNHTIDEIYHMSARSIIL